MKIHYSSEIPAPYKIGVKFISHHGTEGMWVLTPSGKCVPIGKPPHPPQIEYRAMWDRYATALGELWGHKEKLPKRQPINPEDGVAFLIAICCYYAGGSSLVAEPVKHA